MHSFDNQLGQRCSQTSQLARLTAVLLEVVRARFNRAIPGHQGGDINGRPYAATERAGNRRELPMDGALL